MGARFRFGFTLVEVVVVIAIIGILTSMAVPSFVEFTRNQRIRAASSDMFVTLVSARSEALKRNTSVTIVPVSSANWGLGWSIANPAGGDALETVRAFTGVNGSGPTGVTYLSSGRVSGTTAPAFEFSASGSTVKRCVSVDLSGRPRATATAC